MPATMRTAIEDEIERLLGMLDQADADPDLEPDGTGDEDSDPAEDSDVDEDADPGEDIGDMEPSLAGPAQYGDRARAEHDLEFDPSEAENSLGWTHQTNQASPTWAGQPPETGPFAFACADGEQEFDGREPDHDAEREDGV